MTQATLGLQATNEVTSASAPSSPGPHSTVYLQCDQLAKLRACKQNPWSVSARPAPTSGDPVWPPLHGGRQPGASAAPHHDIAPARQRRRASAPFRTPPCPKLRRVRQRKRAQDGVSCGVAFGPRLHPPARGCRATGGGSRQQQQVLPTTAFHPPRGGVERPSGERRHTVTMHPRMPPPRGGVEYCGEQNGDPDGAMPAAMAQSQSNGDEDGACVSCPRGGAATASMLRWQQPLRPTSPRHQPTQARGVWVDSEGVRGNNDERHR